MNKHTPLKEIMTPNPVTLNIDARFCRVAEIFLEKGIRHLPIVNNDGMLMGIISQRDLNRITSPDKAADGQYVYDMNALANYVVKQHIIQEVFTLGLDDTIERALELMKRKKIGCIPVVDQNQKVVGIFTTIDAHRLFLEVLRKT